MKKNKIIITDYVKQFLKEHKDWYISDQHCNNCSRSIIFMNDSDDYVSAFVCFSGCTRIIGGKNLKIMGSDHKKIKFNKI
jgi:hypothetical protein